MRPVPEFGRCLEDSLAGILGSPLNAAQHNGNEGTGDPHMVSYVRHGRAGRDSVRGFSTTGLRKHLVAIDLLILWSSAFLTTNHRWVNLPLARSTSTS